MSVEQSPKRVALLDTAVQIDRRKMANRARHIESLLRSFPVKITTCISLLEFKATIIRECITIHDNLRLKRRFTLVRDSLLEKNYRQVSLRAHIFNNLLNVFASSLEIDEHEDEELATKARLKLEQTIPRLYEWFVSDSVDAVLCQGIKCTRAAERPDKKGRVSFRPNLPTCVRGKNKTCSVEEFIRSHSALVLPPLHEIIKAAENESTEQLLATTTLFERVAEDDEVELSHRDCRQAGDCLIALEGMGHASHALSTNAREWLHLSRLLGIEFIHVRYPDEDTR